MSDRDKDLPALLSELSAENAVLGVYETGLTSHDGSPRSVRAAARVAEIEAELTRRGIRPAIVRRTRLTNLETGEDLGSIGAIDHDESAEELVRCSGCGAEASLPRNSIPADAPRTADGQVSAVCPRCLLRARFNG